MDFLIGGLAGAGATVFSNPMDVVKVRMQLQGELRARSQVNRHYGGILHAMYVIAKTDGLMALQKGLVPATLLGFTMNSVRLGLYHVAESRQWTKTKDGEFCLHKAMFWSGFSGVLSGLTGNPASVLKTRIQSESHPSIAVGRQHRYKGVWDGCIQIYKTDGIKGFYTGVHATCLRLAVGSAAQLSSYTAIKKYLHSRSYFEQRPVILIFVASLGSGFTLIVVEAPLDVANTRLFAQGNVLKKLSLSFGKLAESIRELSTTYAYFGSEAGKLKYRGLWDCFCKTYKTEGLHGLYKGVWPFYFRIAPHTTISLVLWDMLNNAFIPDKTNNKSCCVFLFHLQNKKTLEKIKMFLI